MTCKSILHRCTGTSSPSITTAHRHVEKHYTLSHLADQSLQCTLIPALDCVIQLPCYWQSGVWRGGPCQVSSRSQPVHAHTTSGPPNTVPDGRIELLGYCQSCK